MSTRYCQGRYKYPITRYAMFLTQSYLHLENLQEDNVETAATSTRRSTRSEKDAFDIYRDYVVNGRKS